MGYYAGVRGTITLKPEFVGVVREATEEWGWINTGHAVLDAYENEFTALPFTPLTPLGTDLNGKDWSDDGVIEGYKLYNIQDDRKWSFCSGCKNTDSAKHFLGVILPYIAESVEYLEYYFECDDYSKLYDLADGVVVEVRSEHTFYGDPSKYRGTDKEGVGCE